MSPCCLHLLRATPAVPLSALLTLCASTGAAQTPKPADSAARETAVVLTPFEVAADRRDTYEATNTASLTGINTSLQRVPITADIYNRALLDDLGVTDFNRFLSDVGGYGAPVTGLNQFGRGNSDGDATSAGGLRGRGLTIGSRRDGFSSAGIAAADSFSVERVEVIRGPQSLLYGPGDPGGVVNYVGKTATFGKDSNVLRGSVSSEGTYRAETDFNFGRRHVAFRVGGLNEEVKFYRSGLQRDQRGLFVAGATRLFDRVTVRGSYTRLQRFEIVSAANLGPPVNLATTFPDRATREGQFISLLMAQGRTGDILGGRLNWSNVDSLFGDAGYRRPEWTSYGFTVEGKVTDWLSVQARYSRDDSNSTVGNQNSLQNLRSPTLNPTGQWAVGYAPGRSLSSGENEGSRVMAVAKFPLTRFARNTFTVGADWRSTRGDGSTWLYYLTDAAGNIVVNPATAANVNAGRTPLPPQWVPLDGKWASPFTHDVTAIRAADGNLYVLAPEKLPGVVAPTAGNVFGFNGGLGSFSRATTRENSVQAALLTEWFGGRVDTLLGARQDAYRRTRVYEGDRQRYVGNAKNVGAVWHLRPGASLYYGYSDSNRVPGSVSPTLYGDPMPLSQGKAHEYGFKFNLLGDRLSGSVTRYTSDQTNDNASLPFRDTIDPQGINGQARRTAFPNIVFDRESRGYEVALTAAPIPRLNVRFSYSRADGAEGSTIDMPRFYNDEFHTLVVNGVTVVAVDRGGGVKVPHVVNEIRGNAASPLVPLTLAMMRDPVGQYFATLDPATGRITNSGALGLTTPGVGTGRAGLPISAHQLGYQPPGGEVIRVLQGGERTQGYAEEVFNLTASYRWDKGRVSGLGAGANVNFQRNFRSYYVTDVADRNRRKLYSAPDVVNENVWLSYERRMGRKLLWRTQVNVTNVLDREKIVIQLSAGNGAPQTARYAFAPRLWTWTNTFSF